MTNITYLFLSIALLISCTEKDITNTIEQINNEIQTDSMETTLAKITGVTVSGNAGNYTFNVTIESPDTGCDQYADWWEVISPNEELLYRRILAHSHVNEQPFTRSGGPVQIEENTEVIIRAHMNNLKYGSQIYRGSVSNGFKQDSLPIDFALELETTAPLPKDCAF